jgi:hypothetical protein
MPTIWILPAPQQLPQDYYASQVPPVEVAPPPDVTPPDIPPFVPPDVTVSSGGVYYGPTPPDSPQYGWLWTMGQGRLFVYMEPGIWTQIGTNW